MDIRNGLYFAKSDKDYDYWDLILEVYGKSPFYRVVAYRRGYTPRESVCVLECPSCVIWGPRIEEPPTSFVAQSASETP